MIILMFKMILIIIINNIRLKSKKRKFSIFSVLKVSLVTRGTTGLTILIVMNNKYYFGQITLEMFLFLEKIILFSRIYQKYRNGFVLSELVLWVTVKFVSQPVDHFKTIKKNGAKRNVQRSVSA